MCRDGMGSWYGEQNQNIYVRKGPPVVFAMRNCSQTQSSVVHGNTHVISQLVEHLKVLSVITIKYVFKGRSNPGHNSRLQIIISCRENLSLSESPCRIFHL